MKSGHPASSSMLRMLGFFWAASNFTWEWFLNFVQIFGMPIRWANYDPNATKETIDAICDMLDNMGSAGWGAFPAGTALELKEAMKAGGDNAHKTLLDAADAICDILILGQTLTTNAVEKGTQALGTVHNKVLSGRKLAAKSFVARVLNRQFIPAICLLNFGDKEGCPYFMTGVDAPEDALALAERDKTLLDAGLPMPKAWLYERHEIPVPAAGEEVIEGRPSIGLGMPGSGEPPKGGAPNAVNAKDAAGQLADNLLEDLGGVQARWLGGIKPVFVRLVQAAQAGTISDEDFIVAVERAHRQFPELFRHLDTMVLADRLEREMGAAAFNGAIRGYMERHAKQRLLPPAGGDL
jgi:phage gp29-like protein